MKASELMLHDLVMVDGEYKQVTRLDGLLGTIETESTKINKTCVPYKEEDVRPIPLMEEILKANGFKLSATWRAYCIFEDKKFIMVTYDKEEGFGIHSTKIRFRYVHELQRALRCCGLLELADNFKL